MIKQIMLMGLAALLAGCATSSPKIEGPEIRDTDPMIVQLSATARQAFDAGETGTAVVMYRRALARARAMDNSTEIGRIAYNLAACMVELEEWAEAEKLLAEAEQETLRAGGQAGPILILAAETARRRGEVRQAEALLDRMETRPVSDALRGQAYVMRAELACDRNDTSRAVGFLQRARGFLGKTAEPGLAGAIAHVTGRLAELEKAWAKAGGEFDREAASLQQAGRLPEMAEALDRAGRNYLKATLPDQASDRFYRSARSWMAQGDVIQALHVIEQAVQMKPEEGGDPEVMAVIAQLFGEIRASVEAQGQQGEVPTN